MSWPHSNSTHTTARPTAVAERTRRTPDAPLRAASIGNVTTDSISVGTIPRPSTMIVTVGALKSGRTSRGMSRSTNAPHPTNARARAITITRYRRDHRMTLSIIGISLVDVPVRGNSAGHSRKPDQVGAFGNHPVARLKAFLNLHHAAIANADFDRTPQKSLACRLDKDHRVVVRKNSCQAAVVGPAT